MTMKMWEAYLRGQEAYFKRTTPGTRDYDYQQGYVDGLKSGKSWDDMDPIPALTVVGSDAHKAKLLEEGACKIFEEFGMEEFYDKD